MRRSALLLILQKYSVSDWGKIFYIEVVDILRRRAYTLQPAGYLFFRIPFTSLPNPSG